MIDEVIARLKSDVAALNNRVRSGGALAALMERGSKPEAPLFAYVLYGGLQGIGKPDVVTGLYRQQVREIVSIVLVLRAADRDGQDAIDKVQVLQATILQTLCGWAPTNQVGTLQLARSALVSFRNGVVVWQIDLSITDQLRITS